MEMKILLAGAVFLGGWFWSYLFLRQLLFNFAAAYPLIKKMRALQDDLIAIGARRYTDISTGLCTLLAAIILFLVLRFCPLYIKIVFGVGALIALVILIPRTRPENRQTFDSFCDAYCRFIPDDELRMAFYNKKTGQIKSPLKAMGLSGSFLPDFNS